MIYIPNTPRSFLDLLGISIKHHYAVLKKTILLILMIVVVKDWYVYLGDFPKNDALKFMISTLMLIVLIYLFMSLLYMTHRILRSEPVMLPDTFKAINQRLFAIFSASFIFVVVPTLFVLLAEFVYHLILKDNSGGAKFSGLIFVFVVGIPILYAYLRYFFTLPLIAMENFSLWKAFGEAQKLVQGNWARVFGIYACAIVIWVLVSPDTLHGHFMRMYHVSGIFDFIVFCVTLPIMMNLIVFMRNDLRLRNSLDNNAPLD
jgi:hypothetical protein